MEVVKYKEDIKAIDQTINLINMMTDARIRKVVSVDYLEGGEKIGKYKVNLPIYELGLASILVNRTTHEVLGLYGKVVEFEDIDKIIGIRLDIASECIIIDIISRDGIILKSISTGSDINSYCVVTEKNVTISGNIFELNLLAD